MTLSLKRRAQVVPTRDAAQWVDTWVTAHLRAVAVANLDGPAMLYPWNESAPGGPVDTAHGVPIDLSVTATLAIEAWSAGRADDAADPAGGGAYLAAIGVGAGTAALYRLGRVVNATHSDFGPAEPAVPHAPRFAGGPLSVAPAGPAAWPCCASELRQALDVRHHCCVPSIAHGNAPARVLVVTGYGLVGAAPGEPGPGPSTWVYLAPAAAPGPAFRRLHSLGQGVGTSVALWTSPSDGQGYLLVTHRAAPATLARCV